VHKQIRKELKIIQQERSAKFSEENDLWPKKIANKMPEQEKQLIIKQIARDIHDSVQQSE